VRRTASHQNNRGAHRGHQIAHKNLPDHLLGRTL
jgi:hypothetical protein